MVVIIYISGISGNKEVKKRQQRVLMILDLRNFKYEVIHIAEPGNEEKIDFMQNNSTSSGGTISDPKPRHPLPPQIFNEDVYCGDYDQFDLANEFDEMEKFLKLAPDDIPVTSNAEIKLGNGTVAEAKTENGAADEEERKKVEEKTEELKENEKEENEVTENEKEEKTEDEQKETSEDTKVENGSGDQKADSDVEKEDDKEAEAESGETETATTEVS